MTEMHVAKQRQLAITAKAVLPDKVPKPALPTAQQPTYDPRLKWARPEWIKLQHDSSSSSRGPVAAPTGTSSRSKPTKPTQLLKPRQHKLLNRVTYGTHSSSDSDDGQSFSNDSWQDSEEYPQLFQALGIDFGVQRVGVAIRRSSHNIPLLTLHRQQQQQQQSTSSDKSSSQQSGTGSSSPSQQWEQRHVTLQRTAAAILHLALQEGCDGFIVGLPVYPQQQQQQQQQPVTGAAAAAAAAAKQQEERKLNSIIRSFAEKLAQLAAPLQLPVYLVNEQQSSQQARAVMSGAAAYDIRTQHDLEQGQMGIKDPQQQQQQQQQSSRHSRHQQASRIGRDAFAAALILSRYYNGLVSPIEQVLTLTEPQADSSSSSSNGASWGKKQQQQAADDLKLMMIPPGEQRRRQKQRLASNREATTQTTTAAEAPAAVAVDQQVGSIDSL